MALNLASLPPDLAWLRPADRPSDQEVDAYVHIIANAEGYPEAEDTARLHREAELQLWIWRSENHRPLAMQRSGARAKKSGGPGASARRAS